MRIRSIDVSTDAVEAVISFGVDEPMRTSEAPGSAARVLRELPGLRAHRCDNDAGVPFREEALDTEFAHLVEHCALEVMALAGSPVTLRGTTRWDFATDGRGVFHVAVAYDDDLVALGALRAAAALVAWSVEGTGEPPAVEDEARRLRLLRRR
jgi:hypothetical protein